MEHFCIRTVVLFAALHICRCTNANSPCAEMGGICKDKNDYQCRSGSYISGKCPGTENIKCCTENITLQDTDACSSVQIFSRDTWGARNPVSYEPFLPRSVALIFIHHTAGPSCITKESCATILRDIQGSQIDELGWHDINDNFYVGEDGRIYDGRGWMRVGAHTRGYNNKSLSVSVIGNFTSFPPNETALDAVRSFLTCALETGYLEKDYGLYAHREVSDTECPGDAFYMEIRDWPHYNGTAEANSPCAEMGGICKDKNDFQCRNGSYISGKCPGAENIKCCTENITLQDADACSSVPIFSRDTWGARNPVSYEPFLPRSVALIFIHHTAGPRCITKESCATILRNMQGSQIDELGWHDINDNFFVGEDGRIYEGRGWMRVGAHTRGYNSKSLSVSVIGNFTSFPPNETALDAVRSFLTCALETGYLEKDYGLYAHREVSDTECPGDAFYMEIKDWPHYNGTAGYDIINGANDGIGYSADTPSDSIMTLACLISSIYCFV